MAKKVITELVDDLDGSPAATTVSFGIDGARYEIDLSEGNAAALRHALSPYAEAARRIGAGASMPKGSTRAGELAAMRTWLRERGQSVSPKGRIPETLQEMYRAAH